MGIGTAGAPPVFASAGKPTDGAVAGEPVRVGPAVGVAARRERIRVALGRTLVGEVEASVALAGAAERAGAGIFREMRRDNPGIEAGPAAAARSSPIGARRLLAGLILGVGDNPGLRVLAPGDPAEGGLFTVPAPVDESDECAAEPPLLSGVPWALAIPALPATAAPMPKPSANNPTRPT
ncbi:hypothetical protein [Mycolicibacterium sp. XJ775]